MFSRKIIFATLLLAIQQFYIADCQDGFATLGSGITGGSGGIRVSVCTEDELVAAVSDDVPRIVRIKCFIHLENVVLVGSNKSILGAAEDAGLYGHGLSIIGKSNVIIRGLHFCCENALDDGVKIDRTTNVWVDHNEFYSDSDHDYQNGLVDLTNGADFVTISWNKFHNHFGASVIGGNDENARTDKGKFHVTYHHNFFLNCHSRVPSINFGTVHIYNNYYQNVDEAIDSRMGAEVLVESNIFRSTKRPISTNLDSKAKGFAVERKNDFGGSVNNKTQTETFTKPPYTYKLDRTAKVRHLVEQNAGPTIIFQN